jgi:hypothetical protein
MDYGELGNEIFSLETSPDNEHLFVLSSGPRGGYLKTFLVQYNINNHQLFKLNDMQE